MSNVPRPPPKPPVGPPGTGVNIVEVVGGPIVVFLLFPDATPGIVVVVDWKVGRLNPDPNVPEPKDLLVPVKSLVPTLATFPTPS
jgi:hypothetical protein